MRPSLARSPTRRLAGIFLGPEGSCGRVVLSWAMAGGVAGGGILIGGLTILGYVNPGLQLLAAPVLFLFGSLVGVLAGAVLAVVGRPASLSGGSACRRVLAAAFLSVPAVCAAWVVTAAVSVSAALVGEWRVSWAVVALGGWIVALALCAWAASEGWRALRRAFGRRAPGHAASAIVTGILATASVAGLPLPPHTGGGEAGT